jgi:hypothetical protein
MFLAKNWPGFFIQEGNEVRSFTIPVRKITMIRHLVPHAPVVRNPLRAARTRWKRMECLLQSRVRNGMYDSVSTISKMNKLRSTHEIEQ